MKKSYIYTNIHLCVQFTQSNILVAEPVSLLELAIECLRMVELTAHARETSSTQPSRSLYSGLLYAEPFSSTRGHYMPSINRSLSNQEAPRNPFLREIALWFGAHFAPISPISSIAPIIGSGGSCCSRNNNIATSNVKCLPRPLRPSQRSHGLGTTHN